MKLSALIPALGLFAAAASAAPAADEPNPNEVYFKSIGYNGSGCPISPPSATIAMADDKKSFTIIFDKFVASAGPNVPRTEGRKNCQINLKLHVPGGWQYSIASADFRGWAELDQGVMGRQTSTYYFQGESRTTLTEMTVRGPMSQAYQIRDEIEYTSQSWSPCGEERPININTAIFVDNSKAPKKGGILTTDSMLVFNETVTLRARRC
ncbi:hypothetical protein DFS34DRAFT_395327 [Phlyctochytrium arcticum]|nr:hypothetical protein DFS34DRAFT_395327 [Phlyctochytrium arcticum]